MITDAFSRQTLARMEAALEDACMEIPVGQGHAARQHIASKVIECAQSGRVSQSELTRAARAAAAEFSA